MILVIRHGETDWNRENRILGRTDHPLNEAGLQQAREAARKLADTRIHRIFSSPLSRALTTARTISAAQKEPCPIEIRECLIEQYFGIFEGADRDGPGYQAAKKAFFQPCGGGESTVDLVARVYPFLSWLKEEFPPEENILLSTHGCICRVIASYFEHPDNEAYVDFRQGNCEVRAYEFDSASRTPPFTGADNR